MFLLLLLIIGIIKVIHIPIVHLPQPLLPLALLLLPIINPLIPINLNILCLLVFSCQSGPVWFVGVRFDQHKHHLETGFAPLGFLLVDLLVELNLELVLVAMRFTLEFQSVVL